MVDVRTGKAEHLGQKKRKRERVGRDVHVSNEADVHVHCEGLFVVYIAKSTGKRPLDAWTRLACLTRPTMATRIDAA